IALLLKLFLRVPLLSLLRVVSIAFVLLLLAPAIDLIIFGGHDIAYLSPATGKDWLTWLSTFFGPLSEPGVSVGMRAEIAIFLMISFAYGFVRSASLLKAIAAVCMTYAVIFQFVVMPFYLARILSLAEI